MIFIQALVSGLLLGGVYALLSTGFSLIFGIMRLINFAQAALMMLTMYGTFFAWQMGIEIFAAGIAICVVLFVLAMLLHKGLLQQVTGESENLDAQLIITWGLALMLEYGAQMTFSATPRLIRLPYSGASWQVGPVLINQVRSVGFLVALLVSAGLYYLLQRTALGASMRAVSDDWEMSALIGVDAARVERIAFGVGVGVTAAAGVLLSLQFPIEPFIGRRFIIIMFVSVVLGGLGHIMAGAVGGLIVGIVESFALFFLPAALAPIVVFILFIIVLMVRPEGVLGSKVRAI